jgi:hypothetical protein
MPSIRIGFSTDLNLVNEQVGIGTTNPTARLDVRGQIRADNSAGSGGISTLTRYDGFLNKTQSLPNNVSIAQTTKGNLNSLSGEIVIDGEITVTEGTSLTGGRLDSLTVTGKFDLPHGGSEDREDTPEKGSTRFNQDLGQLEFYTGYEWRTVGSIDGSGRGRGVFAGGAAPGAVATIDYVQISTLGNALDFGSLSTVRQRGTGTASSSIRGLCSGGAVPGADPANAIDYITIASTGNGIDFGDLTVARQFPGGCSSSTRGVFASGLAPTDNNTIDYITISTIGNAIDFGDLTTISAGVAGCSSPTRGIFAGGTQSPGPVRNVIDTINIASTGNSVKFGELSYRRWTAGGCSNGIRGLFGGGDSRTNLMDFITMSTFGNAIYFGDLTAPRSWFTATASQTRGIWVGGLVNAPFSNNTIDYVTIASLGNAQDFGDLTLGRHTPAAVSDSHGGLGGF